MEITKIIKFFYLTIIFIFLFAIFSCGSENNIVNQPAPTPLYTHNDIVLTGFGLQEYHDTVLLNLQNADSIYCEFWSETNIDTLDFLRVQINLYDTLSGVLYWNGVNAYSSLNLNIVHKFGFRLFDPFIKLQILVVKGSLEDKYLRIRNFKIFKVR